MVVGMWLRSAIMSIVYNKALLLSNTSRQSSTTGEIVNLMAVDAQRFMDLTSYLHMLWSAPMQIALSLYFLWQEMGISTLAGPNQPNQQQQQQQQKQKTRQNKTKQWIWLIFTFLFLFFFFSFHFFSFWVQVLVS